jgi:hypothetical protein
MVPRPRPDPPGHRPDWPDDLGCLRAIVPNAAREEADAESTGRLTLSRLAAAHVVASPDSGEYRKGWPGFRIGATLFRRDLDDPLPRMIHESQ